MRLRQIAAALLLLGILVGAPIALGQDGTSSSSFMESFTGRPGAPLPYHPAGWDVQIQSRDFATWAALEPMSAQHGPGCEAPLAMHDPGTAYEPRVFQCSDHVMTSITADGYGVIYLTPPALADLSAGEAVVRWDMSTLRTAYRDWTDVWIGPVQDHLALPLDEFYPDLVGPPRRSVHVIMSQFFTAGGPWTSFCTEVIADFAPTGLPCTLQGYETVLTPDAARRDTFEIHLSRTHIKVGMPKYSLWWTDQDIPDLGWSEGVVQFGHHSYFPSKDCEPSGTLTCRANTWHWDNVGISPYLPVSIAQLAPRQISNLAPGGWTLPFPAPEGSYLQFAANNAPGYTDAIPRIDLSFDGGRSWQTTLPQPSGLVAHALTAARSYWVPLPTGTTAVQVRGEGGYWGGDWQAKDASLWQLTPSDMPPTPVPPTPLPTLPPDVTATPIPATPTRTPEPTATLLPTATVGATATLVRTITPLPAATATPVTVTMPPPNPNSPCQVPHARRGRITWDDVPTSQCR